jgi:hypothetical protein
MFRMTGVRPALAAVVALLVVVSAAGCRRRALDGMGKPDAGAPVEDAGVDARAADVAAEIDVGVDLGPPQPPLKVAEDLERTEEELMRQRFVECFGASPAVIAGWRLIDLRTSAVVAVSRGRAVVDPAKADACLAAIARATCAEIAAGVLERACAELLAGTVPPGGACRADHECASTQQGQYRCEGDVRSACGGRCTPRPPSGERCGTGECVYGTICDRTGGAERCVPSSFAGTPCNTADGCGANDYCRWNPTGALAGTCAPRVADAPCTRPWECPFPYTCVPDGRGVTSHCGVGLPVGVPCHSYVDEATVGPFSDCAVTLTCLPVTAGSFRCSEGTATGELCGTIYLPDGETVNVPCRDGLCSLQAPGQQTGKCRPFTPLGGACTEEWECGARRVCAGGVCVPAVASSFPVGASCPLGVCAEGARCEADELKGSERTCVAGVADGETCQGDFSCGGAFSRCQGGICTPCP